MSLFKTDLVIWAACGVLAFGTGAVFWPVTGHDFLLYDDPDYVTENPHIQRGLTWRGVAWAWTATHAGNWHPVTWLSHMADYQLYGLRPAGHHLTSLLLHAANATLLFLVLRRLTGKLVPSFFVAALFAVHPLRVESVAWVAERKDVLSTFFGFLGLWAYAGYARAAADGGRGRRIGLYLLAWLLFLLGLASKPMLVTWPMVLLLLDWWPLARTGQAGSANGPALGWPAGRRLGWLVAEKIPFLALSLASSIVTFTIQQRSGAVASLEAVPFVSRLANALAAYARYLWKTLVPTDLAILYPFQPPVPWWEWGAGAVLVAGVAAVAVRWRQTRPYVAVGWLWYLGTLVPVIGLVQVGLQSMADRYTYVPQVGVLLLVVWGLYEWSVKDRRRALGLGVGGGLAVAGCMALTAMQLRHWANTESLFAHTLRVTRNNYVAHCTLGNHYLRQRQLDQAKAQFEEALRIRPTYPEARVNLATILAEEGDVEEAQHQLRQVLARRPNAKAFYNLGNLLRAGGDLGAAMAHYQEALRLEPGLAEAHANLGLALASLNRFDEAIAHYRSALETRPNDTETRKNLGVALAALKQFAAAAAEFQRVVRLRQDDPDAHFNLANALLELNDPTQAVRHLQVTLQLKPDDAEARRLLAFTLARVGDPDAALAQFTDLVRAHPTPVNHLQLAQALVAAGRTAEAIPHYHEVIRLQPEWAVALNDLAWILATHPEAQHRNGTLAVEYAERACALTQRRVPLMIGTLAAAYAEAGRYEEAVKAAEEAARLAETLGDKALAARNQALLALYRSGKPYREPR